MLRQRDGMRRPRRPEIEPAELARLEAVLDALPVVEPRPGFTDRLMSRLPDQSPRPALERLRVVTRVLATAAALILGMSMGLGLARGTTTETSGESTYLTVRQAVYEPLETASGDSAWLTLQSTTVSESDS